MSLYEDVLGLQALGTSSDEIDRYVRRRIAVLKSFGATDDEIAKQLGRPVPPKAPASDSVSTAPQPLAVTEPSEGDSGTVEPVLAEDLSDPQAFFTSELSDFEMDSPVQTNRSIQSYWKDVVREVKEWSVGEKAEWGEYWDRGLGKSTINLAIQYHSGGEVGFDAQAALSPEPEDTGHLERWLESITNIGADLPVFVPSALAGTAATGGNIFAGGFTAGFVNESIKSMYIDALSRGEVNNWQDWWDSFIEHGFEEGMKSGLTLGVGLAAPGWIGAKSLAGKYATQYAAFTGVGALVEQRVPTKNELINTALVLGTFGGLEGGAKGTRMFVDRLKKTEKGSVEVLQEIELNPRMKEDLASTNIETFRNEPQPTELVQPFRTDSNPRTQVPEANFDVTPRDIQNIRDASVQREPYFEARESGLSAKDAAEAAKTEPPVIEPPASQSVAAVLDRVQFDVPPARPGLSDVRSKFAAQFLDRLHPVLLAVRKYQKEGGTFENSMTPYQRLRLQPGIIGRGMHFLQYGTLDFKTLSRNGPGLAQILSNIKTPKQYQEFTAFAVAKRAIEKSEQGNETGVPIPEAKATVAELGSKYEATFQEVVNFQTRVIDYLVDSGVLTAEARSAIIEANRDYVPFHRVLDPSVSSAANNFSSAVRNPMKRFKGSERQIQNPIETIHLNALNHVAIAERNKAYTSFIEMVESLPGAFPNINKVPAKVRGTKITKEELQSAFDGPIKPEFADGMTVFRRNGQVISESEIAIFRNGKREVWEVGPEIAGALKDMNGYQANFLLNFLGTPTRLLRAGATLAPDFMVRNLARDALSAAIFSDRRFIPIYHNAMGFWHLIKKDKLYQDWTKSGAMQSMLVSFDRNYFSRDMKKLLTQGNMRNVITNPLEALRIASEFFESSGRVGQFKLAFNQLKRRKRMTDRDIIEQAGFESRDITIDFAKMGTQMQAFNRVSAFFNARVQGYLKIYEAFEKRPVATSAKIFSYFTLPCILLWYKNHDDPRYQDLPQWQKDLFWIFIVGDGKVDEPENYTVFRVPKPFELGLIFGTGAERMMDFTESKDPGHLVKLFKAFGKDAALSMGPIPDFAKPFVEFWANRSFFTDRPIVSRGMENMLPEFQYDEYTSATAKAIGKTIHEITAGYGPSSPQKIDHLIRSWTGTLGTYTIEALDQALLRTGVVVQPEKPQRTLEDLPVIRAFLVRKPTGAAQPITDFFNIYDKISGRMQTFKKLQTEGRLLDAQEVLSETDLSLVPLIGYRDSIANISKTIRLVNASDMSGVEKRQMIDELYLTMIAIAKSGLEQANKLKISPSSSE